MLSGSPEDSCLAQFFFFSHLSLSLATLCLSRTPFVFSPRSFFHDAFFFYNAAICCFLSINQSLFFFSLESRKDLLPSPIFSPSVRIAAPLVTVPHLLHPLEARPCFFLFLSGVVYKTRFFRPLHVYHVFCKANALVCPRLFPFFLNLSLLLLATHAQSLLFFSLSEKTPLLLFRPPFGGKESAPALLTQVRWRCHIFGFFHLSAKFPVQ